MELQFDPSWLAGFAEAEAAARGQTDRLLSLTRNREDDGLDSVEAVIDAADSLGLVADARTAVEALIAAIPEFEAGLIKVDDVHGGMPTWRRDDQQGGKLQLPMESLGELRTILDKMAAFLSEDPERMSAVVAVGLGGTGGCACGDDLPEDAPPGPLFERA